MDRLQPYPRRLTARGRAWRCALLAALAGLATPAAQARYTVEPGIAREYARLQAQARAHPGDPWVNFDYAICLSYVGKIEEGRARLKRVQALDPRFAQHALPRYLARYRRDPGDRKNAYRLGFLYYFDKQYDRALKLLGDVARARPTGEINAWAFGYMAYIEGEERHWPEAERLARKALAIEPEAYGLHAALAVALQKQGEYLPALGEYLTALRERREFQGYERRHLP